MTLQNSFEATPSGSRIAVYRSPPGSIPMFVVGGLGGRSVADTPMAALLDQFRDRGLSSTLVDLAGAGRSTYRPPITMDTWLGDLEAIYGRADAGPSIWIGVSIGAWLMLLLHRVFPEWFRSMCALAPAIDWDATYLLPGVASGKFTQKSDAIQNEHGAFPTSLVTSMASHHLLGAKELAIRSPLHVIYGALDIMASPIAIEELITQVEGAPCTSVRLPADDHSMSKLATAASQRAFAEWLRTQIATLKSGASE